MVQGYKGAITQGLRLPGKVTAPLSGLKGEGFG